MTGERESNDIGCGYILAAEPNVEAYQKRRGQEPDHIRSVQTALAVRNGESKYYWRSLKKDV